MRQLRTSSRFFLLIVLYFKCIKSKCQSNRSIYVFLYHSCLYYVSFVYHFSPCQPLFSMLPYFFVSKFGNINHIKTSFYSYLSHSHPKQGTKKEAFHLPLLKDFFHVLHSLYLCFLFQKLNYPIGHCTQQNTARHCPGIQHSSGPFPKPA